MQTCYCAANHESEAVASVAAAGPVISAIIAKIEALLVAFGPSILAQLPTILAAAGVPVAVIDVLIPLAKFLATWIKPAPAA